MTPHPQSPLAALLERQGVAIIDGGLATELQARGADLDDPLWSARLLLDSPGLIGEVHADYLRAGADIVTTASYQASFEGFARRGIDRRRAAALMRLSVTLARRTRDEFWAVAANRRDRQRPLVAASVGPYGATLADGSEYRGHYALDEAALMAFHRPRLALLAAAGADLLACETLPCLAEARAIARLLAELPGCTGWISFACRDGECNSEGEALADCVAQLQRFDQVEAIGVNCSAPAHLDSLLAAARRQTDKPLVAYPNSGERYDGQARRWCAAPALPAWTDGAAGWLAAGARLAGGCCRTSPADIRVLRNRLLDRPGGAAR